MVGGGGVQTNQSTSVGGPLVQYLCMYTTKSISQWRPKQLQVLTTINTTHDMINCCKNYEYTCYFLSKHATCKIYLKSHIGTVISSDHKVRK